MHFNCVVLNMSCGKLELKSCQKEGNIFFLKHSRKENKTNKLKRKEYIVLILSRGTILVMLLYCLNFILNKFLIQHFYMLRKQALLIIQCLESPPITIIVANH
uniref:Putative ovule protein n=1 Tax=Solanum chacoense TaxID=4108 RepID=A0A0V0I740_SOLCH